MEVAMAEVSSEFLFSGEDNLHLPEIYCDDVAISSPEMLQWSSTSDGGGRKEAVNTGESKDPKGLRLVHLLMAAAEALAGAQNSRGLADVILARLNELLTPAAAAAASSGMESLAVHFTCALQLLFQEGRVEQSIPVEVMESFQLLQDTTPYINFGHFTANQAILEAVAGERRVHIVDYDIMEGVQWASLMQSFVTTKNSTPPPHLRITAVRCCGRKPMVQQTGRRLSEFAAAVGLPFSFRQCRLEPDGRFRPKAVKTVRGEALVFNCALHAPHQAHHAAKSVGSFLAGAAEVSPRVIAVVEESGGGRREGGGIVGRFVEEMVRYSAIWDAMEAGLGMDGKAREMVERAVLAPRIAGAVERAYREDEEGRRWGDWMAEAGYRKLELSSFNYCQAKQLIGLFSEGYGLEQDALNKLTLQWKSRRLVTASIWSAAPAAGDLESRGILPGQ